MSISNTEKTVKDIRRKTRRKSHQRKKLESLCRYITRPAIAERRLSLANNGNVVIALKTPYDDGTTHVVLSLMEFMGRLAALERVQLTPSRSSAPAPSPLLLRAQRRPQSPRGNRPTRPDGCGHKTAQNLRQGTC